MGERGGPVDAGGAGSLTQSAVAIIRGDIHRVPRRSVGKLIRRDLIRCQKVATLPTGVAEKGEGLLTALRDAFGASDEQTT